MNSKFKKPREKLLFLIEILLHSMSIFEIDGEISYSYLQKYWYLLFTFVTSVSVVSSQVSVFLYANSAYERFLAIQSTGGIFSSNSIFLASQYYRRDLIGIYFMVKNGIEEKTLRRRLEITNEDIFKQCISQSHQFGRLIMAFFFNTLVSTIFFAISTRKYESHDGTTLIYASRYPWNYDTPFAYCLTYVLQVISTLPVFLLFWGNMTFITIMLIMFQYYTNELDNLIRNPDFSELNGKSNPWRWIQIYEEHLKQCIRLHQKIRRHFTQFESWFNVIFSAEIAYVTIQVGVLSFLVLKEKQTLGIATKLFFFMAVILIQLYFHCNIGQKFCEMNDNLTKTLHDTIFETNDRRMQRLLMMFIQQTQIPYTLRGFSRFEASPQIFTKLIRTSYGFLNVLRASVK